MAQAEAEKTQEIRVLMNTYIHNEFLGRSTDYATVQIGPALAARIKQLQIAVKELNVQYISEFNYAPEFHSGGGYRLDGHKLVVSDDRFFWEGYLKDCSESWDTQSIDINLLDSEPGCELDLRENIDEEDDPENMEGDG